MIKGNIEKTASDVIFLFSGAPVKTSSLVQNFLRFIPLNVDFVPSPPANDVALEGTRRRLQYRKIFMGNNLRENIIFP